MSIMIIFFAVIFRIKMKRKKMNTPAFLRHFLRRFRWGAEIPAALSKKVLFSYFWTPFGLELAATTKRTVLIEPNCLSMAKTHARLPSQPHS